MSEFSSAAGWTAGSLVALMLVGIVLMGLAVGGYFALKAGLDKRRKALSKKEKVPASAYVLIVLGVILLLPLSYWLLQYILLAIGVELGSLIFDNLFGGA